MISCIIPCYGSEKSIAKVVGDLQLTLQERTSDFEIILVNDSSPDDVYTTMKQLATTDSRVKAIDLAKNFGQHNAIMAGIRHAKGDTLVFLDDDGQTNPTHLWRLVECLGEDCDIVFAKYSNKQHSGFRNWGSSVNALMAKVLIGKPKELFLSSYFACKGFVGQELTNYTGSYSYLAGLLLRTSNKIKNVDIPHEDRKEGVSGYSMAKLLQLWLNGFTAFSVRPLRISTIMGLFLAVIGFLYGLYLFINRVFISPDIPLGWTSLMAVMLFSSGVMMVMLGLIGEYIGRMYITMNNSPQFVVRERVGFDCGGKD